VERGSEVSIAVYTDERDRLYKKFDETIKNGAESILFG
jgi:hypothetical protein